MALAGRRVIAQAERRAQANAPALARWVAQLKLQRKDPR